MPQLDDSQFMEIKPIISCTLVVLGKMCEDIPENISHYLFIYISLHTYYMLRTHLCIIGTGTLPNALHIQVDINIYFKRK